MAYNAMEYEQRLNSVFKRHPNVDVKPMMHNEKLGFESHEKKEIEKEMEHGRSPNEVFARQVAHKGPNQMRELHQVAKSHGHNEFADDLAREFRF